MACILDRESIFIIVYYEMVFLRDVLYFIALLNYSLFS